MPIETKLEADISSSTRCQGRHNDGQCPFEAVPGQKFCSRCHAASNHAINAQKVRNFRLTKHQARVNDFADNQQIKSLREEIGITRLVLEETLNKCQSDYDTLLYAGQIISLVSQIEKLVNSCHKLELSTGNLLDKTTVLHIATSIVSIIKDHVTDPITLESISNKIILIVEENNILKEEKV